MQVCFLAGATQSWVQPVEADAAGRWNAAVPPGSYRVTLTWPGRGDRPDSLVQVAANTAAHVDLGAPPPRGTRVPAGPGRRAKAGPGTRTRAGEGTWRGPWQTLGVADGLPDLSPSCLSQDRKGYLWMGSQGGVSRYDGQEFVTFTTRDGLPGNGVAAILSDRNGDLWIGTAPCGSGRPQESAATTAGTSPPSRPETVWALMAWGPYCRTGRGICGSPQKAVRPGTTARRSTP
ncbi:MAG: two-component regulator propeller domain-containing protein [Candidatus Latescibacterota bacterium]